MNKNLKRKVALVAGATRGAGRAIAVELARAGATVYCSGRSSRTTPSDLNRPETIEETADRIRSDGGEAIAVVADHTDPQQVEALAIRIAAEQGGLDILVNDIWGGDPLTEWGKRFWEADAEKGIRLLNRSVATHLITARFLTPRMLGRGGLIVEVTDGDNWDYRGNMYYDLAKTAVLRIARNMAEELKSTDLTALAVTPGFMRSEAVLDHFGVTETNWREAVAKDAFFEASETPHYLGRGIAALAADPNVRSKAGGVYYSSALAEEYGFTDLDGAKPNWPAFAARMKAEGKWPM